MPRHYYRRRMVKPDPLYNSYEVAKCIRYVMRDGKQTVAQDIVYTVFDRIEKDGKDPMDVFHTAIVNVTPEKEVRPRRIGGASYLVPQDVRRERKLYLALHWIIDAARARSNKEYHTFADKLYAEINEAAHKEGQAYQKRLQTEKVAESNRVFAHLKW